MKLLSQLQNAMWNANKRDMLERCKQWTVLLLEGTMWAFATGLLRMKTKVYLHRLNNWYEIDDTTIDMQWV